MPKPLMEFPAGLQFWLNENKDAPYCPEEGYCFDLLENSSDSYRFTAISNAERTEGIFTDFAALLGDEAFLILEFYQPKEDSTDEETWPVAYYSPMLPPQEILTILKPYLPRLIHDGFVGFGLANNRAGLELFYSEEKILTCFTGNHIRTMDLFARHGVPHQQQLALPTDRGHDHLSLLYVPHAKLPASLATLSEADLDYANFCMDILDALDMYPVDEEMSVFFSPREQEQIMARLEESEAFADYAEEDFGALLIDWSDFVQECEGGFRGDLSDYLFGLMLRDLIQFVAEGVPELLRKKILDAVSEADTRLDALLTDRRKRLDPPADLPLREDRFWYRGVVGKQSVDLRRDLIRRGWFQP